MLFSFGVSSEGDNGRVFEEEENVSDAVLFAKRNERLLQFLRSAVVYSAEMDDGDHVYVLMGIPYTAPAASSMASASVG